MVKFTTTGKSAKKRIFSGIRECRGLKMAAAAKQILWMILVSSAIFSQSVSGAKVDLKNRKMIIAGDSITDQMIYSVYVETWLRVVYPDANMRIFQYGISGEQTPGLLQRLAGGMIPWKPDIVTLCYGMNDGGYREFNPQTGEKYAKNMRAIIKQFADSGATVIVGSPGVVDPRSYRRRTSAEVYNETLGKLAEIARQTAGEFKMPYADIHNVMLKGMNAAKAALGSSYNITVDGVHPHCNGHMLMTYAFLKAMGVSGDVGKITMDFKTGRAEATAGHKILQSGTGKVRVKSSKYPFCFTDNKQKSILPFVPFQQELNRMMLVVENLPADKAEIIWGEDRKTFTREQLAKGINLAAEFVDRNPFKKAFCKVSGNVGEKQKFEWWMNARLIKAIHQLNFYFKKNNEILTAGNDSIDLKKLFDEDERLQKKVIDSVQPVVHDIQVLPLK